MSNLGKQSPITLPALNLSQFEKLSAAEADRLVVNLEKSISAAILQNSSSQKLEPQFSSSSIKVVKSDVAPSGEVLQLIRPLNLEHIKSSDEIVGELVNTFDYKKMDVRASKDDLSTIQQAFGSNLTNELLITYDGSAIIADNQQDLVGEKYLAEQIKRIEDQQKRASIVDKYSHLLYEGAKTDPLAASNSQINKSLSNASVQLVKKQEFTLDSVKSSSQLNKQQSFNQLKKDEVERVELKKEQSNAQLIIKSPVPSHNQMDLKQVRLENQPAKNEPLKQDQIKPENVNVEQPNLEKIKIMQVKQEAPKQEPPKAQPPKQEPPKQEPPKQEPPKQEPPKQEPPKQEPPKQEPLKQEPPKAEPPKQELPKQEPPKQEPPKQEPPKQEPPKQEPPKQEPPKAQPPKQEPPKQEPPKQEPPKQEPPKAQPPKQEPPKQELPKQEPPKQEAPKSGQGNVEQMKVLPQQLNQEQHKQQEQFNQGKINVVQSKEDELKQARLHQEQQQQQQEKFRQEQLRQELFREEQLKQLKIEQQIKEQMKLDQIKLEQLKEIEAQIFQLNFMQSPVQQNIYVADNLGQNAFLNGVSFAANDAKIPIQQPHQYTQQQQQQQQQQAHQHKQQQQYQQHIPPLSANIQSVTIDAYNDPNFKAMLDELTKPLSIPPETIELNAEWPNQSKLALLAEPIIIPAPDPIVIPAPDVIKYTEPLAKNVIPESIMRPTVSYYPKLSEKDMKFYRNFEIRQINLNNVN